MQGTRSICTLKVQRSRDDECTQQSMDLERDDLQGADDLAVKADERRMEMRRGKIIAVTTNA